MSLRYLLITFTFIWFGNVQAHPIVCIIIHGTWASTSPWYKPGGDFFLALEQHQHTKDHIKFISFTWSGANNDAARHDAARQLMYLIDSYPSDIPIFIIAHSHGGNVAILTSQLLTNTEAGYRIKRLYTLGVPVSMESYAPNMEVIGELYNLFSFNDLVQPVLGLFDRIFPDHPRRANIRLVINGSEPLHTALHQPLVGRWILEVACTNYSESIVNFTQFDFIKPGVLYLADNEPARYETDSQRLLLINQDHKRIITQRNQVLSAQHVLYHLHNT